MSPVPPSRWSPQQLLAELKRRKVLRVALVYGIVGAGVMETVDIIVGGLGLPLVIVPTVIVLTMVGFPLTLVLAWAFDITREGVVRTEDTSPTGDLARDAHARKTFQGSRRMAMAGLGIVALSVGVTSWVFLNRSEPSSPVIASATPRYVDSVAVMPLDNFTGDPRWDYLGSAITEEIISHLVRIGSLKVISRHSVQALAQSGLTAPQLADSLKVGHIVEGSFQFQGNSLRATLQQVDDSDSHLWAETFLADTTDLIEAQEIIAQHVVDWVTRALPAIAEMAAVADELGGGHGPGNEAYQLGGHQLGLRTSEGLRRAIELFEHSIREDSTYAPAHADLSSAYALALTYRYALDVDEYEAAALAVSAAERAIQLDPMLATAYSARGYAGAILGADPDDVSADFGRAAEIAPNDPRIPSWSTRGLAQRGEFDEAIQEARRAVDLDPVVPSRHMALAHLSLHLGDYDQAIEAAARATRFQPELVLGRAIGARAQLLKGQAEVCVAAELGPHDVIRATCLWQIGRRDEASAIVDSVRTELENGTLDVARFSRVTRLEDLAIHYAWLGDAEEALIWVRQAYAASPTGVETRLYESALFDPLRDDQDFVDAVDTLRRDRWERVLDGVGG